MEEVPLADIYYRSRPQKIHRLTPLHGEPSPSFCGVLAVDHLPAIQMDEHSGHRWTCGVCGETLIDGAEPGAIQNVALRCAACGAFNDATT